MVGILVSFWDGLFSGAKMLVVGSVIWPDGCIVDFLLQPGISAKYSLRWLHGSGLHLGEGCHTEQGPVGHRLGNIPALKNGPSSKLTNKVVKAL